MRILMLSLAALFLFACTGQKEEQVINLNVDWKFIQGDNPDYAKADFDDSSWKTIKSDKIWEQYGYDPYDGFAWYRLKVVIPSDLKNKASLKDSLIFHMGKINNFDQTFLNGIMIGSNGKNLVNGDISDTLFRKAPTNYWDLIRRYTLSVNDERIKWDAENVIAVRVFDEGGQGGLWSGDQYVRMTKLTDYLAIDSKSVPFAFIGKDLAKDITVYNTSDSYTLTGKFSILAVNKLDGSKLLEFDTELDLKPAEKKDFPVKLSQLDQSALLTYTFTLGKKDVIEEKEETPYILTPAKGDAPGINGPAIYGQRPGRPFLYTIPVSGKRPVTYAVEHLPEGLSVDANTGIITGKVAKAGTYEVMLKASNEAGSATRPFKIVIGEQLALTPPLGWNSWNCWGLAVDEQKVIASAKAYKNKGLIDHGWSFINIDDGWEIHRDSMPKRDARGNIITNYKFPNMKRLADSVHNLGLKLGIYSSPGPLTCGQYTGSYQYELNDARSYAAWGIDYLKYDWCSYGNIAKDTTRAEYMKPYFTMRDALAKVDRDIVYSLCQYGMDKVWEWGAEVGGNLWRTTGDITDTWESMSSIGFNQVENAPYAGPGHWNDPDMLVVGWVGWGPSLHPTKLTPDEQYTHISLWCLLSSPLLIGCDLERLDEFTLNLLTNDEVLAINQDILGKQATPVYKDGDVQVWVKELADGTKAIGVFNLGDKTTKYSVDFQSLKLDKEVTVRDLWRQKDLGKFTGKFDATVPSHGVVLVKTL